MGDSQLQPVKDETYISNVDAHKHHSIEAMKALRRIMESLLEVRAEVRQDTVSRLLDYAQQQNRDNRKMALVFAPESEFPDRVERWPEFFKSEEKHAEESVSEDEPCLPG